MHSDPSYPPKENWLVKGTFPKISTEKSYRLSIFPPEEYKLAAYCRARVQLNSLLEWRRACVKDTFGSIGCFLLGDHFLDMPLFQKSVKLRCLHCSWIQQSKNILMGLGLSELEFNAFSALERSNRLARQLISFEMELITGKSH